MESLVAQTEVDYQMNYKKKDYIEALRIAATLAVVMIHICMTEVVNSSIVEIGRINYVIYTMGYAMVRWAVPVFIMITGHLLLQPTKKLPPRKISMYIKRIAITLLVFGTVYAMMEIVFSDGLSDWYLLLPKALLRVVQMQSWDHLWYLYFLIGLYIMTPFTKAAIKQIEANELWYLILTLSVLNYIIPTINMITGLSISKFWIAANGYFVYYLVGYYVSIKDNLIIKNKKIVYAFGALSLLFMCIWDAYKIIVLGDYSRWLRDSNCLVPCVAIAVFVWTMEKDNISISQNKIALSISKCSLGIYLLHPFYINLIYKVFRFTPTSVPIVIGIIILYILVFALSWITTVILTRIPIVRKLV